MEIYLRDLEEKPKSGSVRLNVSFESSISMRSVQKKIKNCTASQFEVDATELKHLKKTSVSRKDTKALSIFNNNRFSEGRKDIIYKFFLFPPHNYNSTWVPAKAK